MNSFLDALPTLIAFALIILVRLHQQLPNDDESVLRAWLRLSEALRCHESVQCF